MDSQPEFLPSEKQVAYAQQLAQRTGIELPPDALGDKAMCSAFIDEALSKSPPSSRQLAYAEKLALAAGIGLPPEATGSAKACSEFIDRHQATSGSYAGSGGSAPAPAAGKLPTDKQILYAANLARQHQLGLSHEILSDRMALSSFIDGIVGGAPTASTSGPVGDPSGFGFVASDAAMGSEDLLSPPKGSEADSFELPPGTNEDSQLYREGQIPF